MPYYQDLNILYIHIPKTGGSSVEAYLKEKNNGQETLYSGKGNKLIPDKIFQKYSLQHQFYSTLHQYQKELGIRFNQELKVFSVVRNPYHRLISGLFWKKWIDRNSTQQAVYEAAKRYIASKDLDNHNTPQYKFLVRGDETLYKHIHVFRTETLSKDMRAFGFRDYKGKKSANTYWQYYNQDLVDLVNDCYKKDFAYFGYSQIGRPPSVPPGKYSDSYSLPEHQPLSNLSTSTGITAVKKQCKPSVLKYYTIFGERNSGTNYLAGVLDAHLTLKFTKKFGFKHWFIKNHHPRGRANQTTDNECFVPLDNSDDTLFIFIVRNPYDWCGAMKEKPYHIKEADYSSIYNFISKKYIAYEDSLPPDHGPDSPSPWYIDEATKKYFIEAAGSLIELRNLQ